MMIHCGKNVELNCHKNVVKTVIKTLISTAAKSVARDCIRPCVAAVSRSSVEGDTVTVLQCCRLTPDTAVLHAHTRHCSAGCCSCHDVSTQCHAVMHISCLMVGPHVIMLHNMALSIIYVSTTLHHRI